MNVGLVLGGGGARALAHIGVLRAFEERGLTPSAVVACSSAAVIGALYAAGHRAARLYDLAKEIDFSALADFDLGRGGLLTSDEVAALLRRYAPPTFEALELPLAVVAVDIQEGDLVVLRSGALAPAVCASNALPGVFEPVFHGGRYLIDGGVLNIVPTDVIGTLTDDPVVAIDVSMSPKRKLALQAPSLWDKVTPPYRHKLPLSLDILLKAYTLRQAKIKDAHLADHPPELLIRPALGDDFSDGDFRRLDEAVECGYREATRALQSFEVTAQPS